MSPDGRQSPCPIASALDLFGDRWTLLVLRDLLLFGKQRYREFLAAPEAIASNILSDRLKRLEAGGFVSKAPDPADRRQVVYTASDKGRSLLPVLLEIAAWGAANGEGDLPPAFAERYRANREAFIADPSGLFERPEPNDA